MEDLHIQRMTLPCEKASQLSVVLAEMLAASDHPVVPLMNHCH
jgi:hypothetical protein